MKTKLLKRLRREAEALFPITQLQIWEWYPLDWAYRSGQKQQRKTYILRRLAELKRKRK